MPKRKKKASVSYKKKDDKNLMLLAGSAAIIVGFFAIFAYKSSMTTSLPTPTPAPSQIVTLNLNSLNKSGETGTATLQEVDGKVVVTLSLAGFPKGVSQPAHIHTGSCPNPGAVEFPLTSVVDGQSVTTVNTTLSALKAMGPLAINVHKSVASSSVYYSCGNISL